MRPNCCNWAYLFAGLGRAEKPVLYMAARLYEDLGLVGHQWAGPAVRKQLKCFDFFSFARSSQYCVSRIRIDKRMNSIRWWYRNKYYSNSAILMIWIFNF